VPKGINQLGRNGGITSPYAAHKCVGNYDTFAGIRNRAYRSTTRTGEGHHYRLTQVVSPGRAGYQCQATTERQTTKCLAFITASDEKRVGVSSSMQSVQHKSAPTGWILIKSMVCGDAIAMAMEREEENRSESRSCS
jgi:hypothetical protein